MNSAKMAAAGNASLMAPWVNPMPAPQGWLCPKCQSAHAPTVQTCPISTLPLTFPYNPMGGGAAVGVGGCLGAGVGVGVAHGPIQGQEYKYNNNAQGHGL